MVPNLSLADRRHAGVVVSAEPRPTLQLAILKFIDFPTNCFHELDELTFASYKKDRKLVAVQMLSRRET